jgi:hypothetical protein
MKEKCEHKNKVYSSMGTTLTCYSPINISYWICKDCGFEGEDRQQAPDFEKEYRETKQKFGKLT